MTHTQQVRIVIVKHCPNCRPDDPMEVHRIEGEEGDDLQMKIHAIWEDRFDRNKEFIVLTVDEAFDLRQKLIDATEA